MGDIDIYPYPESNNGITDIAQQPSAPVAPDLGELWMDTDENASTGLSSVLAFAAMAADQTGITAEVPLNGLSVSVIVPAGRRLRISVHTDLQGSADGAVPLINIKEDGAIVQRATLELGDAVARSFTLPASVIRSPSAGIHTYSVTAQQALGGGPTISINAVSAQNYILVEDITGSLWPIGSSVNPSMISGGAPILGYKNGGIYTERATNPINAYADGTASITIPNPGIPVMVTAAYNGFGQNFSAITFAEARVAISFDGGSSFTAGVQAGAVFGQGGSNYNRGNLSASWFRSGTPTGNIVIKMEAKSDSTATGVVGHLTYTMMPL
jgi:hypothetical protein